MYTLKRVWKLATLPDIPSHWCPLAALKHHDGDTQWKTEAFLECLQESVYQELLLRIENEVQHPSLLLCGVDFPLEWNSSYSWKSFNWSFIYVSKKSMYMCIHTCIYINIYTYCSQVLVYFPKCMTRFLNVQLKIKSFPPTEIFFFRTVTQSHPACSHGFTEHPVYYS